VKAARNAKNQRKALIQEHAEEMEKMKKDHDKLASELSDTHAVETEALVTEISTKSKQTKEVSRICRDVRLPRSGEDPVF
jgi:hypothetical protein